MTPALPDAEIIDRAALLGLNRANEKETSKLDPAELDSLIAMACHVGLRGPGGRDAFLIALDQDAPYRSLNFLWFKQRYPRFAYVDRIVVGSHAQRRGFARSLYEELFDRVTAAGHSLVCAEIVAEPPNLRSDAFHAALGFKEVGRSMPGETPKPVRFVTRPL